MDIMGGIEGMAALLPGLTATALKGSALVLGLMVVSRVLRRSAAATRHVVWATGLATLVALPLLGARLPWRLPVLPASLSERATAPAASFWSGEGSAPVVSTPVVPTVRVPTDAAGAEARPDRLTREPAGTAALVGAASPLASDAGGPERAWPGWGSALVLLWLAGVMVVLAHVVLGGVATWWIVRRAEPLTEDAWAGDLLRITERLGLARPVRLLRSARVPLAFTTGLLRPVVVLPPDCATWTAERRGAVLLHELAHVRRRDLLMHLLGRAACAIHWFNPLVWLAARRQRAESERACDDLVLRAGTRASDYAGHLLELVRSAGRLRAPAVVLPMAQLSEFEGRLLAILEPDARRHSPGRLVTAAIAVMIALSALPLAALSTAGAPDHASPAGDLPMTTWTLDTRGHFSDDAGPPSADDQSPAPRPEAEPRPPEAEPGVPPGAVEPAGAPLSPSAEPKAGPEPGLAPRPKAPERDRSAMTPAVVAGLAAALEDPDSGVRRSAAHALGEIEDTIAVEALVRALLNDEDAEVRSTSAWALGQLENRAATEALMSAVTRDEVAEVRRRAAWALGEIEDARAVPALGAALEDADPGVRKQAAWALGQIESPAAVGPLSNAAGDADAEVRQMVIWALTEIEDARAGPVFERALRDEEPEIRAHAIRGLAELEPSAAPAGLLEAARDAHPEVRRQVAWALGEIGDPAGVPALRILVRDSVPEVRRYALRGLAEIGDDSAIQAMIEALSDADPEVRREAARALGRFGGDA